MPRKRKAKGKTRLESGLEGTQDVFGALRKDKFKSGLSDDVFGFKAEISGKKKGKKSSVEDSIGNIYGDL